MATLLSNALSELLFSLSTVFPSFKLLSAGHYIVLQSWRLFEEFYYGGWF